MIQEIRKDLKKDTVEERRKQEKKTTRDNKNNNHELPRKIYKMKMKMKIANENSKWKINK